jgi:uncharacterized protein YqgC (DUF456 family)
MPSGFFTNPAANLTLLLILVGLVGAVVPIIPGPPLIWLGALAWAYGENFRHLDWITLAVLGMIALVATFAEVWLTPLMQRQAGFSWKEIGAAFIGGILGGIFLSEVPVAGTLFGAAVGSLLAVGGLTLWQSRSVGAAWRASKSYLIGCALSSAVEITLSLLMIAIFAWRAFFS